MTERGSKLCQACSYALPHHAAGCPAIEDLSAPMRPQRDTHDPTRFRLSEQQQATGLAAIYEARQILADARAKAPADAE